MAEINLHDAIDTLGPDQKAQQRMLAGIETALDEAPPRRRSRNRRVLTAVAAICFVVLLSVPVLAATVPAVGNVVEQIAQDIWSLFQPVNLRSEDQGIELEVLAAYQDGDHIEAYIGFRDLENGRFDEDLDLYNYNVQTNYWFFSGVTSIGCISEGYDEETGMYIFRLIGDGTDLAGRKITISISSFMANRQRYEDVPVHISEDLWQEETISVEEISGISGWSVPDDEYSLSALLPTETAVSIMDFVHVTAAGVVDGKLHIQTRWEESIDNYGFISLIDSDGEEIPHLYAFTYDIEENTGVWGNMYKEYVFDTDSLEGVEILAELRDSGTYIEGDWAVTFVLEDR